MKTKTANVLKAASLSIPLLFGAAQSSASILELALLIDGSGSISNNDFNLQIDAYVNIFEDDFFSNIITGSIYDSVFVGAWQFAGGGTTDVTFIGEQNIASDDDADTFAVALSGEAQRNGTTPTGDALRTANTWFDNNGIVGIARVVDISTDGQPVDSNADSVQYALESADIIRAAGGTVNAIGIGGGVDATFLGNLTTPNGFFVQASSFGDFEAALRGKLQREIQGEVPAPGTLVLLGIGLLAGGYRKFRGASVASAIA